MKSVVWFESLIDDLQLLVMREEVGALPSSTSKRLEDCEGSFSKDKVRYKRLTGADNNPRSPVPNSVLEDVTNVLKPSHYQESAPVTQSNNVQRSEVLNTEDLNSAVLSYIEMSQYRAEKASICDKSDIINCSDPMVGVIGHEKKLTFKSVNSIVCDLSQRLINVEGKELVKFIVAFTISVFESVFCDLNCKVAVGDAAQPLRRSKRFRLLGSLGLSKPGKINVEKFRGQSSVSFQSQDWKENIDPKIIDDGVLRHEKKLTFKSVDSIVCDLSQQVSNVEEKSKRNVGSLNTPNDAGVDTDETRLQPDSKLRYDAAQPLRRSKRYRMLGSSCSSQPGKNNVDVLHGQTSGSFQSHYWKENIDSGSINLGVLRHEKKLTFKSVNSIVCDLSQQVSNVEDNSKRNVGSLNPCNDAGKNNVEAIRGQSSVSSQSQALKENIDPDCIHDRDKDDDKLTNASVSGVLFLLLKYAPIFQLWFI
ncbi:hypothetical protein RIF29_29951 [Crotalaria pallida]|uniref:Uncharacterized protein n=1 Tax=Crotalaria pallida TaxID=3830 RepID=A0AAN9EKM4_CROPI